MSRNENNTRDSSHDEQDDDLHHDDAPNGAAGTSPTLPASVAHTSTAQSASTLYDFGIVNGQVTRVLKTEHGVVKNERVDANEAYTVQGSDVIKTETKAYGQEITRYVDPDGDGLYAKFSEQWLPTTSATGGITPVSTEPLYERGGDGDDHLAVRSGPDAALGGQGADRFVVREWGHVTIGDFHHGHHDRLVFDMGQGFNSVDALAQRVTDLRWQGDDLVLEMGADASVTLVGARINGIGLEDIDVLS